MRWKWVQRNARHRFLFTLSQSGVPTVEKCGSMCELCTVWCALEKYASARVRVGVVSTFPAGDCSSVLHFYVLVSALDPSSSIWLSAFILSKVWDSSIRSAILLLFLHLLWTCSNSLCLHCFSRRHARRLACNTLLKTHTFQISPLSYSFWPLLRLLQSTLPFFHAQHTILLEIEL